MNFGLAFATSVGIVCMTLLMYNFMLLKHKYKMERLKQDHEIIKE